jgi:hypothetical protein
MGFFDRLSKMIVEWRDQKYRDRYTRIMSEIEQEKDPQKKLTKQVLLELRGTLLGGMASSTAYMSFKTFYFDKLNSDDEKNKVKETLLQILRSNEHCISDKASASHVCADIVILEAIPEIEQIKRSVKTDSIDGKILDSSLYALRQGKPIREVTLDILRQRGEL